MSEELYKWLKEVNLNYQELSKIDDNKWVLVNSNTLYYLFSLYFLPRNYFYLRT